MSCSRPLKTRRPKEKGNSGNISMSGVILGLFERLKRKESGKKVKGRMELRLFQKLLAEEMNSAQLRMWRIDQNAKTLKFPLHCLVFLSRKKS